ncbi:MAG TPA: hypothetical protein VGF90_05605 [Verrucomicrobiae bacterium]
MPIEKCRTCGGSGLMHGSKKDVCPSCHGGGMQRKPLPPFPARDHLNEYQEPSAEELDLMVQMAEEWAEYGREVAARRKR